MDDIQALDNFQVLPQLVNEATLTPAERDARNEAMALALVGRRCSIRGTKYMGTVTGYSRVDSRLPILVSIDRTCAGEINCVMPYSLESVVVFPMENFA